MDISAEIKGITYKPLLFRKLDVFEFKDLAKALNSCATFILNVGRENSVAVSWWVSAKRTRSYPYARVYDSLGFSGKKLQLSLLLKTRAEKVIATFYNGTRYR